MNQGKIIQVSWALLWTLNLKQVICHIKMR